MILRIILMLLVSSSCFGYEITLHNDLWAGQNEDREFTGGLQIRYNKRDSVSLLAYTPNIKRPIVNDRPYSSLIYWQREWSAENKLSYLRIGALGLDIVPDVQQHIHQVTGSTVIDDSAWDNQISDGGELTLLYGTEFKSLITDRVSWSYGYEVGYNTNVNIKLSVGDKWYVTGIHQYVIYDALLQGQFKDNVYELQTIEPNVTQVTIGYKSSSFGYAISYVTSRYNNSSPHLWGSITFNF